MRAVVVDAQLAVLVLGEAVQVAVGLRRDEPDAGVARRGGRGARHSPS